MIIEPFADHGFLIRGLGERKPWQVVATLQAACLNCDYEAVPGWDSVALIGDSGSMSIDTILGILDASDGTHSAPKNHSIPVCLERGLDTLDVCEQLGLALSELGTILASAQFVCEFLGFQPGFPYLSGLPDVLCGLPRRASPRSSVPAGSVGITGVQCGIYPAEVPGGWNLIGRTPLNIANVAETFFPISAGDIVRFSVVSEAEYGCLLGGYL